MTVRTSGGAALLFVVGALLAPPVAAQVPVPAPAPDGGVPAPDGGAPAVSPPDTFAPLPPGPPPTAAPDQISPGQSTQLNWQDVVVDRPSPWDKTAADRPMFARWRSSLYGFVELDAMHDSTQSYGQSANNAMLARPGTYAATHGRTQMTANNSLFGFRIGAPASLPAAASAVASPRASGCPAAPA